MQRPLAHACPQKPLSPEWQCAFWFALVFVWILTGNERFSIIVTPFRCIVAADFIFTVLQGWSAFGPNYVTADGRQSKCFRRTGGWEWMSSGGGEPRGLALLPETPRAGCRRQALDAPSETWLPRVKSRANNSRPFVLSGARYDHLKSTKATLFPLLPQRGRDEWTLHMNWIGHGRMCR